MWRTGLAIAAGMCVIVCNGCGLLVSKKEFFRTSFSSERPEPGPYVVTQAQEPRTFTAVHLPDLADVISDPMIIPASRLQREHVHYLNGVYDEIEELRNDLVRIAVRADQKGAAGRAAVDGQLRSFLTSLKLINRYVEQFHRTPLEWDAVRTKVEVELNAARDAVREASEAVGKVRAPGSLIASNSMNYGV